MNCTTGPRCDYFVPNSQRPCWTLLQDFVNSHLIIGIHSGAVFADEAIAAENRTDDHGGARYRNTGRVLMCSSNRNAAHVIYERRDRGLCRSVRECSGVPVRCEQTCGKVFVLLLPDLAAGFICT